MQCVQLVRLLFWNRHSTDERVDVDNQQDLSSPSDTTSAAAAAATAGAARVNAAFSPDDDHPANSQSLHRHDGLSDCSFHGRHSLIVSLNTV